MFCAEVLMYIVKYKIEQMIYKLKTKADTLV